MLTILLGQDVFKKQQEIAARLPAKEFEVVKVSSIDQLPNLASLSESTLFGLPQAYIFESLWKDLDPEVLLSFVADSPTQVFILEDTIDQRKTTNKNILQDKRITVIDCPAPKGEAAAREWLKDHAKSLDVQMEHQAAMDLAKALVPEEFGTLSVSRAHNELMKLKSYADGQAVSHEMVAELVNPLSAINIFELLDAVGSQQKPRALQLLSQFYDTAAGDEKTKTIQLTALLADQLRNILLVSDAGSQQMADTEILKQTGWKSGRLFIMKKLARSFTPAKLRQSLSKLESLDLEAKSSTLPTQVVLDLIIADM